MTVGHNKTRQHRTSGRNGEKMVSRHKGSKEGGVPRKEGGESKEGRGMGSEEGREEVPRKEGSKKGREEVARKRRSFCGFQWVFNGFRRF